MPIPLEKVVAIIFELPATMTDQYRLFADLETLPPGNDAGDADEWRSFDGRISAARFGVSWN